MVHKTSFTYRVKVTPTFISSFIYNFSLKFSKTPAELKKNI